MLNYSKRFAMSVLAHGRKNQFGDPVRRHGVQHMRSDALPAERP